MHSFLTLALVALISTISPAVASLENFPLDAVVAPRDAASSTTSLPPFRVTGCPTITLTSAICPTCVVPACIAVIPLTQSCGCGPAVPTIFTSHGCDQGCDNLGCAPTYAVFAAPDCGAKSTSSAASPTVVVITGASTWTSTITSSPSLSRGATVVGTTTETGTSTITIPLSATTGSGPGDGVSLTTTTWTSTLITTGYYAGNGSFVASTGALFTSSTTSGTSRIPVSTTSALATTSSPNAAPRMGPIWRGFW